MKNLLKAILLVLDEALLVALVLFVLWELDIEISPYIIATVVVLAAVVIFFLYKIIVSLSRKDQVGAREGLIGLHGKVIKPLTPEGVIKVHGEIWKARCINDESISSQEEVIVADVDGLILLVKRKDAV